jgi:hypothetical protein
MLGESFEATVAGRDTSCSQDRDAHWFEFELACSLQRLRLIRCRKTASTVFDAYTSRKSWQA